MDGIFNAKFPITSKKKIKPDDLHRQSGKTYKKCKKHQFILFIYKASRKNTDGNFLMQNPL